MPPATPIPTATKTTTTGPTSGGIATNGVGMSRSQLVAEHLPLLRRYARALTGNQASGDAYVGAMLEALLQDPSLLDEQHGPRAGLFRLFTQIWNSVCDQRRYRRRRPCRCRPSAGCRISRRCRARLSCCCRWKVFPRRRSRSFWDRYGRDPQACRCGRPRNGGGDRHRRPDHRGRDIHRDGSGKPGEEPRSPRDRRCADAFRRRGAGQEQRSPV